MKRGTAAERPDERGRRYTLGSLLLLAALGAGIYLRFSGIGRYGFWTDELFHVFAALSFLQDGTLHVPWSPHEYTRALPVTLLTALSFKLFGQSEASARVFFALTNVLFIVTGYALVKRWFSRSVAVIFVICISLSVLAIQMSQECRMYTLFQLSYSFMSVAFFRALEPASPLPESLDPGLFGLIRSRTGISFAPLAVSMGLGLFAVWLQPLAYNFGFVVLAYCGVLAAQRGLCEGSQALIRSKYAVVTLFLLGAIALLALTQPEYLSRLAGYAAAKPGWNRLGLNNYAFYRQTLMDSHPFLWAIYPLGAFLAIYHYGKRGLFFVLSFCVPFALHCFVFRRTSERYIFQLLPFFLVVGAVAVDFAFSAILDRYAKISSGLSRPVRALFVSVGIVTLMLVAHPMVRRAVLDTSIPKYSNWKDLDPAMVRTVKQGASVTTDRLRFNYYFGQYPDYVIDSSDIDRVGGDRVVVNAADLEDVVARHPGLHLVTYGKHLYNDAFVGPGIRERVLRDMTRVDREADGRIMVFRGEGGPGSRDER